MSVSRLGMPMIAAERRVALFYFFTMMPLGAAVTQAGVWFASEGLSSVQIGVVNATPVLIMIALSLAIGRIADRAADWRLTIVIAAAIQAAVTTGLFVVDGFWGILAVWTLSVTPNQAIGPVLDAAAMRMTQRNGSRFGPLRACATVGYLLSVGLTGFLVDRFGDAIFVPLYVGLMLVKAAIASGLPVMRAPPGSPAPHSDLGASRLSQVMRPWFVLPLLGYAIVFGTHIILNAFAALVWAQQGIGALQIGQLIVIGAVAEAAMMFAWGRMGGWITAERALLLAGTIAALRWLAMGLAPPFEVLALLQLLHAITFAMGYLGCVQFVAVHTRERIAAEAQSFCVMLQQSMSVLSVIAFGWIVSRIGVQAYLVAGGFALLGATIILFGTRMRRTDLER